MIKIAIKDNPEALINSEWLVTNGLGGFSCGTLSGTPSRKYHGLLISALPVPLGRTMMLNYVAESIVLANKTEIFLSSLQMTGNEPSPSIPLIEFKQENGLPIWRYEIDDISLEKRLSMICGQNTVQITYLLHSSKEPISLRWRPYLHFRAYGQPVNQQDENELYSVDAHDFNYEISRPSFPILKLCNNAHQSFQLDFKKVENVFYTLEYDRGYEFSGHLSSPGYFDIPLASHDTFTIIASTEPWDIIHALTPEDAYLIEKTRRKRLLKTAGPIAKTSMGRKLVLASDQFIVTPYTRFQDLIRVRAGGEEARSVIAGYPWFADWGRDTMISLEGLTLSTGRHLEAHAILHTFAHYMKDGLIPNMFHDGESDGLYNTADATLWFFHSVQRYVEITGDDEILEFLLPKFKEVIESHVKGTRFGIQMDADGLLRQGENGCALTWMDAKVDDWVVTPRRGKAVEINSLWYNALRLYESWSHKKLDIADRCYESFNKKFWYAQGNYLYDVIDGEKGNDASLRPNQLFSISLTHPILDPSRWNQVFEVTKSHLLTPFGLRTLSPKDPDYKIKYSGNLRSRDAAYHQGTVWPWLIGPYIDVWLKIHPQEIVQARQFLEKMEGHLEKGCIGTLGEIFDANEPYNARGCFAQAWSVAELLRSLIKTST